MQILKRIHHRFFSDPYRMVKTSKNIRMGRSKLGSSFSVRLDCPREDIVLQIGDDCVLNNSFVFESTQGKVLIGNGVFINAGSKVISRSSIEIGNWVSISWGCTIYDHDSHSLSYMDRVADHKLFVSKYPAESLAEKDWSHVTTASIKICDHVWLGFDVLIQKGVTLGEGAVVGAKSVVTKDIPPWTVATGNPARVVGEIPLELRRA